MKLGDVVCVAKRGACYYANTPCNIYSMNGDLLIGEEIFLVVSLGEIVRASSTSQARTSLLVVGRVTGYVWAHNLKKL